MSRRTIREVIEDGPSMAVIVIGVIVIVLVSGFLAMLIAQLFPHGVRSLVAALAGFVLAYLGCVAWLRWSL